MSLTGKTISLLLAVVVAAALPLQAQTNKKIEKLRKEHSELKKQIGESEKMLRSTKKDVASQLNNLAILNAKIGEQQKYVEGIQTEVTRLSGNIDTLSRELAALRADLTACKHKYRHAVSYMNNNRLLKNKWTFVLMAKNFRQMYRRMRYASEYSKHLRAQGEIIKEKEKVVRAKQEQLQAARQEQGKLLTEARTERKALEGQKAERQGVVNELNKKQSQLQSSIAQARKKQNQLNARIDQLVRQEIAAAEARRKKAEAARRAAEERKRKEAEARRRAEAANRNSAAGRAKGGGKKSSRTSGKTSSKAEPRYEAEDAADRTLSGNFAANRGRLPVPITGSYAVTSRYGQYNVEGLSGVTLDSKGINLTGQRGAQARCVYDGEVSAVANIGNSYIIIVRHGSYYSVYSNLSRVSVRRGQRVSTRQTLGTVATEPSGNCTLHFQLRRKNGNNAEHINPLPWLAR